MIRVMTFYLFMMSVVPALIMLLLYGDHEPLAWYLWLFVCVVCGLFASWLAHLWFTREQRDRWWRNLRSRRFFRWWFWRGRK